jgi:hypothetical protein
MHGSQGAGREQSRLATRHWTGEAVYNPFDVLLLFENRKFQPWWYETGTPEFLVKLLAERGLFTPDLANFYTSAELLSTFDVEQIGSEALLFQTGYLTILQEEQPVKSVFR